MKNVRKLLASTLALALAVSVFAGCSSKGNESPSDDGGKEPSAPTTLVAGTTTDPNGEPEPWWTNGGADYDAYKLSSGYGTVSYTKEGEYIYDKVTLKNDPKIDENADGSKTWTFTLNDNLKWSNGEKITAKDYVFALLFWTSPAMTELEVADNTYGSAYKLKGWEEYSTGKAKEFAGVKLLSDSEFSVTVDGSQLPYYFEMTLVSFGPSYMKGWVPEDVTVESGDNGAFFSDNFTAEHIGETVEAFRWKPTVFSGPYVIEGFNTSALEYTLKKNPEFLGDYSGQKAQIDTIILKKVEQETMMDELRTGKVDMLAGVVDGDLVIEGLDMVDEGLIGAQDYPRNGYGYIHFVADHGPTQFKEVRQAIGYLLDRTEFAKTFTKGYGSVVHGAYGLAMREYQVNKGQLDKLNQYSYSLDKAVEVLEAGGWTLDANKNPYNGEGIRHKDVNGQLMPLSINWASSENNAVSDLIATMLVENPDLAKAGIEIKQTVMTFNEMYTQHYANMDEEVYHMYNLATNYTSVFDVKSTYAIGSTSNYNQIADEQLAKLAGDMLDVEPGDEDTYMKKWVEFQTRYNELLPSLPLYSNQYADFFTTKLENYEGVSALWDFSAQILYSTMKSE